jgi:hypothetical protein
LVTVEPEASGFDRLEIGHAFRVTVTQGDEFSVVIRIDDNLEQYLQVEQNGDTLTIDLDDEIGLGLFSATLEADVTMPTFSSIDASGASEVTLVGFTLDADTALDASGASRFDGQLEAPRLNLTLSGASAAELHGSADSLRVDASGASTADLAQFPVTDADVLVSGASNASVDVSGTLQVEASGASHVSYSGDPTLGDVNVSGASSVEAN